MTQSHKSLTLRQIATLAGASKSTVSRVLTGHPNVAPKTREKIQKVIQKHGFEPNLFARGLAGGRTGLIAVLASQITSGFFAEVMHGIDDVAVEHGGHLLSCIAHGPEDYQQLLHTFGKRGRVDGVVLLAPPVEIFSKPPPTDCVPLVLCSARPPKGRKGWGHVDTVTVNNTQGIDDVMEHLKAIGCRCIWHLAGPPEMYDAGERASRFDDYVRRHPELHGSRVLECGINPADGRRTLLEYMDLHRSHPDSVVAFNDATAYGVLDALHERNLPIPEKVAVVGCDDEPATAILGLTSLHMPMRAIGEETAQMLFERLNRSKESSGARHSVLDMSLEVRATTALS